MKVYTEITADLQKVSATQNVRAAVGDTGRAIRVRFSQSGEPYIIEKDCYAVLMGTKSDGTSIFNSCRIENNAVIYDFTEQTCACPGSYPVQVRLYGPDRKILTSVPVEIHVYDTVYEAEQAAASQNEQTALDELVNRTRGLMLDLGEKQEKGDFDGESAYEIAVRLGYTGSEESWIQSLKYDHSAEFTALASQVRENTKKASAAASQAEQAAGSIPQMIDDQVVSTEKTQSSLKLYDSLCLPFEASGTLVTCQPVPDYPLHVQSAVSGQDRVELTRCGENLVNVRQNTEYQSSEGAQQIYKIGEFPCSPLKPVYIKVETADEPGTMLKFRDSEGNYLSTPVSGWEYNDFYKGYVRTGPAQGSVKDVILPPAHAVKCIFSFAPGGEAGKPVMIKSCMVSLSDVPYAPYEAEVYTAAVPAGAASLNWSKWEYTDSTGTHPMAGDKPNITALSGTNILYSSTGDTTVSGRQDPMAAPAPSSNDVKMDVLWENASVTSAFAQQEVAIRNLDQYDLIAIFFVEYTSYIHIEEHALGFIRDAPEEGVSIFTVSSVGSERRSVKAVPGRNVVYFSNVAPQNYGNEALVPKRIVGIKLGGGK